MTENISNPTINIRGKLIDFSSPMIMGIVNATPDSFFKGSVNPDIDSLKRAITRMVSLQPDIIDIGACSTRPGADDIPEKEEWERLKPALEYIRSEYHSVIVSVDTYRASIAEKAVTEFGADIINDISGGNIDPDIIPAVANLGVPYVLTHSKGTPADMQSMTDYKDVVTDVLSDLAFKLSELRLIGVNDVIIDPGFGFAKTTSQNFALLAGLEYIRRLGCPLLAGLSRKSMIWKTLGTSPEQSLTGTVALNMLALNNGADILRVHDVREAKETAALFLNYKKYSFK